MATQGGESVRKRFIVGAAAAVAGSLVVVLGTGVAGAGPKAAQKLPASACGPVIYKGSGSPQVLIASDLPLQGANRPQTTQMSKAIEFILGQKGWKAGKWTIGYQSCDDSTAQAGKWDAAKCTANARAYAADRSVVGVIGTFNSGCAKLIIPILNRAPNGPLAMMSPANTYPGLTHAAPGGSAPGEPGSYYPTGKRNYARVVASDDFQSPADAMFTKSKGKTSVYVLTDNETYGKGVADLYVRSSKKLGIKVLGNEAWDAKASSYEAIASKIKQSGAQAVFLGGIVCNNGAKLLKDLRAGLGANTLIVGPDGFTPFSALGDGGNGMFVSVAGPPVSALKAGGKAFVSAFVKFQKRAPDPYSVYAAQAADVLLSAISRSNGTRASIASKMFGTKVVNGIMGNFTIDRNGDTTLKGITIYQVKGTGNAAKGNPVATLYPPASLIK
jgi:branched-chain amino acid transport system substrate-binding protein